jgi:cell wall assembly regulator SMI1
LGAAQKCVNRAATDYTVIAQMCAKTRFMYSAPQWVPRQSRSIGQDYQKSYAPGASGKTCEYHSNRR